VCIEIDEQLRMKERRGAAEAFSFAVVELELLTCCVDVGFTRIKGLRSTAQYMADGRRSRPTDIAQNAR
jgi:hypothetical protein